MTTLMAQARDGVPSISVRKLELDRPASIAVVSKPSAPEPSESTPPSKAKTTTSTSQLRQENIVVIGKGTRVAGTIENCDVLDVYGVVDADAVTAKLIVRDGGQVNGNVRTDDADIAGSCTGTVAVNGHLDVKSSGRVWADVSYRSIALAMGATLSGKVWNHDGDAA